MNSSSSWSRSSLTTVTITTIVAATSSYYLYKGVSEYGWEGLFWLIWEGDPYPPKVRSEFHTLDNVQEALEAEARILDRLEEAYQRAVLETVEAASSQTVLEQWNAQLPKRNLDKLIARVNHNLDLYASQVDSIPSSKHHDLKLLKKKLSNRIVQLMQRADIYVGHYQAGQQQLGGMVGKQ